MTAANFNLANAESTNKDYQKEYDKYHGKTCEKFIMKQERLNMSYIEQEHLNKKAQEMQSLVAKILCKKSQQTSSKDKKKLMRVLQQIPLDKRKDIVMQITKQLHESAVNSGKHSKKSSIVQIEFTHGEE